MGPDTRRLTDRDADRLEQSSPPSPGLRRPRRSVVVLAGEAAGGEEAAGALADSLAKLGIEISFLGREQSPDRIAEFTVEENADSIELCLAGGQGVALLRSLLRALTSRGRRDVSIVVHRRRASLR